MYRCIDEQRIKLKQNRKPVARHRCKRYQPLQSFWGVHPNKTKATSKCASAPAHAGKVVLKTGESFAAVLGVAWSRRDAVYATYLSHHNTTPTTPLLLLDLLLLVKILHSQRRLHHLRSPRTRDSPLKCRRSRDRRRQSKTSPCARPRTRRRL